MKEKTLTKLNENDKSFKTNSDALLKETGRKLRHTLETTMGSIDDMKDAINASTDNFESQYESDVKETEAFKTKTGRATNKALATLNSADSEFKGGKQTVDTALHALNALVAKAVNRAVLMTRRVRL